MKINFDKYRNMQFTLEKVEDTKFNGEHPNGYNVGLVMKRALISYDASVKSGTLFVTSGDRWFHTSTVTKQEEHEGYDLLYTPNSIYKITPDFVVVPEV